MDDLDHSIHIAEFDWTIFYDESEECSLLQPSLACPDDSRLSDSEDSENSKSTTGQQKTEHSPDVNSFGVESNSAGCRTGEEACIKLDESSSRGEQGAEDRVTQVDSETCLGPPAGNTNEVHKQTAENTVQTETAVPEELKKDGDNGDLHTETNNSSNESNPLFVSQTELHMNEPLATDRAVREDWSSVTPRAEKERWFVTVNDSPSRRQTHASSVKKKRRQKKLCKNSATTATNMCNYRRNRREKSLENGLELEINKHKNDSEGDRDAGDLTQSNHKMVQMSDRHHSDATNPDSISDLSQMSCDEDSMSDKLLISDSPKEIETIEPVIDRNKHEPGSSASTSHDTFTLTDPSQLECAMSDEVEDAAEFFSIHSYDSESYLSAAESMEETQHALLENLRPVDLIHSQCSESLVESAVTADKGQTHTCDSVPSCNVSATDCDSYEHTDVEPTYADQKAIEMPDDNSTCDNKTHSTVPHMLSDTPGAQEHKINFSASGCSSGDQLSLLSVPELTLTPCSVADNPEAYAEAAGNTRPVYAISAFWDEMEKLTINDILQLRMGRSSSLTDTRETVSADVDDSLTSQSPLTDTAQYNLSDVGLMDTSDTADSDYFTQTDESKPDRSSCEFSTSDFDEEYWQFLDTSENSSPDPHSKNQTSDCPSLSYEEEEEESTSSEGKETPVPSEDFAGQGFEDQESNSLSKLDEMWPQHMTKSKSMYNIQALNKEDLISSFGDNNNSLFLSSCQSLEKNMVLKVSDNLGTPIPEPFLSTYSDELWKISYPEVFEYFFTEDKAKTDSTCVSVYNPEDISVFDCTFGTLRDDMSFFSLRDSLCREEKPIPIFSSIREITLPQSDCVFLSADCEVGDLSPIKVVSCAFIQGNGCGAAAGGSQGWKSLLSMRKIRFHDKGSIWCRRSGGWVFPVEAEKTEKKDPLNSVLTEGRICTTSPQLFTDLTVQQSILQTIQTTRREGIFSTLKQSDMCLVCIAFASWVLRSSDPEAADTWKAALLANVSALSAIQYLRQYVKKKNPPQDHP